MLSVECRDDVVHVSAQVRWLRRPQAVDLCGRIEDLLAACSAARPGLMMDLNALSRATPAAGLYAVGQLRSLPVARIALVGGSPFMRAFGRIVLTLGRFAEHAFFPDERAARAWLAAPRL